MKNITLAIIFLSTVSLLVSQTWAADLSEVGITLTPDQMKWEPNHRVPGLGVARIIGSAKKTGPFVHKVKVRKAASYKHTVTQTTVPIQLFLERGTSDGARPTTNQS